MILKIDDKEVFESLKPFLEDKIEGIDYELFDTPFNCFLKHELEECRSVYSDEFGDDTLNAIEAEVEEVASNSEIDCITALYFDVYKSYSQYKDLDTVATYTISNNISVEIKDIIDDEVVFTCGNNVYVSEIVIDGEDNECIELGELLLPIKDFVRVMR